MTKIKLYHDLRNSKSDPSKEAPLTLALTHRSRTVYTPLNISLVPEHWDARALKVVKHPKRQMYNDAIKKRLIETERALLMLIEQGRVTNDMTATEIRNAIDEELLAPEEKAKRKQKHTVEKVFETFMSHKKGRTLALYTVTLNKLREFSGKNFEKLKFEDINKEWLQCWDDFLAKTAPSPNARGFHLRNLRAVFNDAIDNEITQNYPFRRFKIKTQETKARNLHVDVMRNIIAATNLKPWTEKYRDFFVLSFMLCGMNVVDMCSVTEDNLVDGRIVYTRSKTHKSYSIKLEPEAMTLIDKYRGEKRLLNFAENYQNYRHFYNNLCRGLAEIKKTLGIKELTSYWARHSWATLAGCIDIPKDTVALGLGHGKRDVTDIYFRKDVSKLDEANRKLLDWVLYDKL